MLHVKCDDCSMFWWTSLVSLRKFPCVFLKIMSECQISSCSWHLWKQNDHTAFLLQSAKIMHFTNSFPINEFIIFLFRTTLKFLS